MALNTSILTPELQERALEELWYHSIIGLVLVEKNGKIITANPSFCNMVEFNLHELQEKTYQEITHPDDLSSDVSMADRVFKGDEQGYTMKKRYITKTGKIVWALLQVRGVTNKNGEFMFFISQVSELIELQSSKIEDEWNRIYVQKRKKNFWRKIKEYWNIITFGLMILGALLYYIWEASVK